MDEILEKFDKHMRKWGPKLRDEVLVEPPDSLNTATTIFNEVSKNRRPITAELLSSSPVPLEARKETLLLSALMDDTCHRLLEHTQGLEKRALADVMITHKLYVTFLYVADSLFDVILDVLPGTTAAKCSEYLRSDRPREFRNSFAHGNWRMDSGNFYYWPKVTLPGGLARTVQERASLEQVQFWCALSRSIAIPSILAATP